MEPFDDVREKLPGYLRLHVGARFVDLTCSKCGEVIFVVRRERAEAEPERILEAAKAHRCPAESARADTLMLDARAHSRPATGGEVE